MTETKQREYFKKCQNKIKVMKHFPLKKKLKVFLRS